MAILKTIIKVPSLDAVYNVPGEWTAESIKSTYRNSIAGIDSMTSTVVDLTTSEGNVREITFAPRTGNKG